MKKGFGYILAGVGAVAGLAGIYYVVTGHSAQLIYGFKALYVGLAGVAMFTLGLAWIRD